MTNYLKKSLQALAAGALALALPVMAQAAVLDEGPASNTVLENGVTYNYQDISIIPGNILQTYTFGLTPLAPFGGALSTTIAISGGTVTFGSFTLTGPGGVLGDESVVAFPGGGGFIAAIQNIAFDVPLFHTLELKFSISETAEALVSVQVTAVPLPAAGLLLLGGLGGLGFVARRRKSIAA